MLKKKKKKSVCRTCKIVFLKDLICKYGFLELLVYSTGRSKVFEISKGGQYDVDFYSVSSGGIIWKRHCWL